MHARTVIPAALGLGLLLAGAARAAGPVELYYERALMSTAGERCKLFAPEVASALKVSTAQARGAALKAGQSETALDDVKHRADLKAYGAACDGRDLGLAADRVRNAFAGYGRLWKMDFPSANGGWTADRTGPAKPGETHWRLIQRQGDVSFGMLADPAGERLAVVLPQARAAGAASARLLLRDPRKAPRPYLDPRKPGLAGALPPRASALAFLASDKFEAPESVGGGVAFAFPASAVEALARLDPREAVKLELVFPTRTGERVDGTLLDVGDFAAGRAFLAAR